MIGELPSKEMTSIMVKCPAIYGAKEIRELVIKKGWTNPDTENFVKKILASQVIWKDKMKKEAPENNPMVKDIVDTFNGEIEK